MLYINSPYFFLNFYSDTFDFAHFPFDSSDRVRLKAKCAVILIASILAGSLRPSSRPLNL